jgi:hypothetical protein
MPCKDNVGVNVVQDQQVQIVETVIPIDRQLLVTTPEQRQEQAAFADSRATGIESFLALFENRNPLILALMIALVFGIIKKL